MPTKENPKTHNKNGQQTPSMSIYEQSREERIKENLQRLQKLGIVDLSQKLNSAVRTKRTTKHSRSDSPPFTPVLPSGPLRRSSRLQNATPVSYSEVVLSKKDKDVKLEEGSKPEVYTEEHEKLLGKTERSWTFFVDGYGEDGRRIYDSVKGKTCHQCRQKTLGHRTHCSECNMVQGQFCGDCLYMRYGEHVLEALDNPNWICPVCRGICNCSLCRQAKGWCPTGPLYKKISSLGFKSVAHYLIQTRRAQTTLENIPDTVNQASAKRSLSFSDREALLKDSPQINENELVKIKPQSEDMKDDKDLNTAKECNMQGSPYPSTNSNTFRKRSLLFSNIEPESKNVDSTEVDLKVQNHFGLSTPQLEKETCNGFKGEEEKKLYHSGNDSDVALDGCPKSKKRHAAIKPIPDSITGRLRQRRRKGNDHDGIELSLENEKRLEVKQALSNIFPVREKEMPISDGTQELMNKPAVDTEPVQDSKAGRSRQMEMEEEIKSSTAPGPDSIARRLRPRNKPT